MIATTRRIGGSVLMVLVLIATLAVVYLTAPSGREPERMAASDMPEHALHCAVCRMPLYARPGTASQLGMRADEAETTSAESQAERTFPQPIRGKEAPTNPPQTTP
jgi:hypothetical protein